MSEKERNLPNIQDLYGDIEMKVKANDLNVLLNHEPSQSWIQQHPIATKEITLQNGSKKKVPLEYIPIDRIEWLLTRIFIKWRVEIREVKLIANSVNVTVRLHYLSPLDNTWEWQDGVGAAPLQTKKGSGAIDFNQINSMAVSMASPSAESYAIKDAAEKIGKLFGKDLNRSGEISYGENIKTFESHKDKLELKKALSEALEMCQDKKLKDEIIQLVLEAESKNTNTEDFYNEQISKLIIVEDE